MQTYHTTVLLKESIDGLNVKPGQKYIDATLGGGGHTREILDKGGLVLSIDADQDAILYNKENFKNELESGALTIAQGNFKDIEQIARVNNFDKIYGIIFDLGVSSHQFDTPERGFSFQKDAVLDMRMDRELSVTAKDLVNGLTKKELEELFQKFGEERFAGRIAELIVKARRNEPLEYTQDLAELIRQSLFGFKSDNHPATRVFQALRIAVNDEMNSLKSALPKAVDILSRGGRLSVISFHSLEDRIVKNYFIEVNKNNVGKILTKKPIIANEQEVENNKRSRSAKLRILEKI